MKQYYSIKAVHPDAILLFGSATLRDVRRRRDQGQRHSGHHAHTARQRLGHLCRAGRISPPRHRHLPAQTGAGGRTCRHLRTAGGSQAGPGTGQARRYRAGDAGRGAGRQYTGQQGERLSGVGLFRPSDHGRGVPRHLDGRVLRGRRFGKLHRQTHLQPRAQGGHLPARLRRPFFRRFWVETLHLPPRRMGFLRGR